MATPRKAPAPDLPLPAEGVARLEAARQALREMLAVTAAGTAVYRRQPARAADLNRLGKRLLGVLHGYLFDLQPEDG